jgi:hypothetical protein
MCITLIRLLLRLRNVRLKYQKWPPLYNYDICPLSLAFHNHPITVLDWVYRPPSFIILIAHPSKFIAVKNGYKIVLNADKRWTTVRDVSVTLMLLWVTVTGKRQRNGNGTEAITGQIIFFRALISTIYVR